MKRVLKWIYQYLTFFLLVAFVTTCCVMVFVNTFANTMGLELSREDVQVSAKLTFALVAVMSLLFTIIDVLRRKYTVEKPVKQIVAGARQITRGDFSVRIPPRKSLGTDDSFNQIIDCFNDMARELGSVETLRTDFVANVSHEMKTPLTVIRNYGTLLQTPELPEEKRMEYAKGVSDGAKRMSDMMTNILKLNRLENQNIFPQPEEFDLTEQLCQCILAYEGLWEQKRITVETNLDEQILIRSDRELLSLVWNNLLSNAFKFTGEGGTVTVTLTARADSVDVRIADTGCGMSSEVGSHIFEKFYQGDPSHATQGNGLGLALVRRVVDILRAQIQVESTMGQGSAFTVTIGR